MRYILFSIGDFHIYSYGFMIALGIIAAFMVAQKRAEGFGLSADSVFNLGVWAAIGGLLGAKILYFITEIPAIIENPKLLMNVATGFVVYGGIIGGILTGYIYCRIKKMEFLKYFDIVMPSIALAQAFGRIGCFLAGCCYGKETDAWYGITFHGSPFAPEGVSLIPTQLISAVGNLIIFFILIYAAKKFKHPGQTAGLYLVLNSIGRFLIEFLRNDDRGNVGRLSTSQFIAIFICAAGIFFIWFTGKRKMHRRHI